jgi:hypothetical protein
MSRPLKKISLKIPSLEGDHLIKAAAESDPDAHPLTDEYLSALVSMRLVRGRPKLAN